MFSSKYGIASLILGICSILLYSTILGGLALGIIGLCLGITAVKKAKAEGSSKGIAIAGIVCSSIGLAISAVMFTYALELIIFFCSAN